LTYISIHYELVIDEGDDYDEQNILGTPCQLVIAFSLKYKFLFILLPFVGILSDAILPRKGPVTRAMSKRLQEDWARVDKEGFRVLMNLRVDF